MRALIRMDWTLHRRSLLKASPLFLVWLAAGAGGPGQLLGAAFLWALMAVVMPIFPYVSGASFESFLLALPVSRAQVVGARYLSALAGLGLALSIPLAMAWACHHVGTAEYRQVAMADILAGFGLLALVWATVLFLYFPFHFRLGGERGVGAFLGALLAAALVWILFKGWDALGAVTRLFTLGNAVLDGGWNLFLAILGFAVLGSVSFGLSTWFYLRRLKAVPLRPRTRLLLATAAILAASILAAYAWAPRRRALEAALDPAFRGDAPGGAVLVVADGRTVLRKAYGRSNVALGRPDTPDTPFVIGSLTKQFTAALVLMEVEAGRIDLEKPLRTYVPEMPGAWGAVTVAQALSHTGGIPNYTEDAAFLSGWKRSLSPAQVLAAYSAGRPLDFAPGSRWHYSNTGYLLLGMALERTSGRPYARLLETRICGPLGLRHTHAGLADLATGGYGEDGRPAPLGPDQAYAAGDIVSTVDDLAAWGLALAGGRVLRPASLARMTTPLRTHDGQSTGYGFGIMVNDEDGRRLWWHNGRIRGFSSYLAVDPDRRDVLVLLFNTEAPPGLPLDRLLDLAFDRTHPERVAIPLPAAELEALVGTYELDRGFRMKVWREGRGLKVQAEGQPAFDLEAEGPWRCFIRSPQALLVFEPGPGGRAAGLTLHQGGRAVPGRRIG